MPFFISWLDHSETQRQKMLDIISDFGESESRDELGIGVIRDAIADILFPGTSTLQRGAKYLLFIPWIYQKAEIKIKNNKNMSELVRKYEIKLIEDFVHAGKTDGLIGKDAREKLLKLPGSIYWAGLQKYGIIRYAISQARYFKSIDDNEFSNLNESLSDDESETYNSIWHREIPHAPEKFLDGWEPAFELNRQEAEFIKERIITSNPRSLLAFLVDKGEVSDSSVIFPWAHPQYNDFTKETKDFLLHASNFSEVMHGAALLYNLMLAQKAAKENIKFKMITEPIDEIIESYHQKTREWFENIKKSSIKSWILSDFWKSITRPGVNLKSTTVKFVETWIKIVIDANDVNRDLIENTTVQDIIKGRERMLKTNKARLQNNSLLENWTGASGANKLNYRWNNASVIINDTLEGLK